MYLSRCNARFDHLISFVGASYMDLHYLYARPLCLDALNVHCSCELVARFEGIDFEASTKFADLLLISNSIELTLSVSKNFKMSIFE